MPADDLTDPAPATTFAHLDATTVLSRGVAERGIYPAVDPLDSTSRIMDPNVIGAEHYGVARDVQKLLQDYKSLQDIIAILGMDELSEEVSLCFFDAFLDVSRSQVTCRTRSRSRGRGRLRGSCPSPSRSCPPLCPLMNQSHLKSQVAEVFTNNPGKLVPIAETISGFQVGKWN